MPCIEKTGDWRDDSTRSDLSATIHLDSRTRLFSLLESLPVPMQRTPRFISTRVSDARYYYLDLHPRDDGGTAIVCGGVERCDPDYEIRRSTFPYLGIEFVAEGRGSVVLDDRESPLGPGVAFSYGSDTRCEIRNDPDHPLLKYFVDFVGHDVEETLRRSPLGIGGVVQLVTSSEFVEIFEWLHREGTRGSTHDTAVCATLLQLLLLKLGAGVASSSAGAAAARALETYESCRQHIDRHYLELASVSEVATAVHVDPSYLCRLFRRFAQTTPYAYLMRRKMNHAVDRLLGSGLLVKQVALEVGFDDPYHFSRVFRKVHGVSPREFVRLASRGQIDRGDGDGG